MVAVTSLAAFGSAAVEAADAAAIRPPKLARTIEMRSTCPYCAVAYGISIYAKPEAENGGKCSIMHIDGDPNDPTNRGTLCPKEAALLELVRESDRAGEAALSHSRRHGVERSKLGLGA